MSDVAIKPLGDRVVVRPLTDQEAGTVSVSGIIIPDSAKKEKPEQGRVMAIGPKVKEVKKGDLVLFTQYAPNEIKVDGKELLVIKEEDILAIIE